MRAVVEGSYPTSSEVEIFASIFISVVAAALEVEAEPDRQDDGFLFHRDGPREHSRAQVDAQVIRGTRGRGGLFKGQERPHSRKEAFLCFFGSVPGEGRGLGRLSGPQSAVLQGRRSAGLAEEDGGAGGGGWESHYGRRKGRGRGEGKDVESRLLPLSLALSLSSSSTLSAHFRRLEDEMRCPVAASKATTASNAILLSRGRRIEVREHEVE